MNLKTQIKRNGLIRFKIEKLTIKVWIRQVGMRYGIVWVEYRCERCRTLMSLGIRIKSFLDKTGVSTWLNLTRLIFKFWCLIISPDQCTFVLYKREFILRIFPFLNLSYVYLIVAIRWYWVLPFMHFLKASSLTLWLRGWSVLF